MLFFTSCLQSLHHHKATDNVHVGFNKLMSELNKKGAPYALSLANRLYGEQSYQFVEVKPYCLHSGWSKSVSKIRSFFSQSELTLMNQCVRLKVIMHFITRWNIAL